MEMQYNRAEICRSTFEDFLADYAAREGHSIDHGLIADMNPSSNALFICSFRAGHPPEWLGMETLTHQGREYDVLGVIRSSQTEWKCAESTLVSFFTFNGRALKNSMTILDFVKEKKKLKTKAKTTKVLEDTVTENAGRRLENEVAVSDPEKARMKREKRKAKDKRQRARRKADADARKRAEEEEMMRITSDVEEFLKTQGREVDEIHVLEASRYDARKVLQRREYGTTQIVLLETGDEAQLA